MTSLKVDVGVHAVKEHGLDKREVDALPERSFYSFHQPTNGGADAD